MTLYFIKRLFGLGVKKVYVVSSMDQRLARFSDTQQLSVSKVSDQTTSSQPTMSNRNGSAFQTLG
jgi:hypothetical protein